MTLYKQPN